MKTCPQCKTAKPVEAFFFSHKTKDKLHWCCKTCDSARKKKWYAGNYEKAASTNRKYLYGVSETQYQEQYRLQDGVCAICKNIPDRRRLDVDHCHKTGKIRGLLCQKCNRGLGNFGDSLLTLISAVKYAHQHK